MHELTDRSPLLDDARSLRRHLAEDGYLFVRGLLPDEVVGGVRAGVFDALGGAGWLAPEATVAAPVPTPAAVREGAPGYLDAYAGIQRLQAFHELAHHERLTGLLAGVLDEPLLVHPRKIARTSLPRDDEYTPPHQDYRLIQGSVDTLTCWVPLGDCPVALGGLRVLEGSHAGGLREVVPGRGPGGLRVDVDDADPGWRTTDYRAGDVLVFTSLTVHGALRNDRDHLRFSADFRYQSLREPVASESLEPHYAPRIAGWDALTAGWTSRTAVEVPEGVVPAATRSPLDPELRAAGSRLLAAAR